MKSISAGISSHQKKHKTIVLGRAIAVFGFILFIGISHALPSALLSSPSVAEGDCVCNTEVCNEAATLLLNYMDETVDPCENFYQYACGNFIKDVQLQEHETDVSTFSIVQKKIDEQLNQTLNSSSTHDNEVSRLLKKVYKSCMDTDKIESIGTSAVMEKLKTLGGWPVVDGDAWNETSFDWLNTTYKSRQLGILVDGFFSIMPPRDLYNVSNRMIQISTPALNLGWNHFNSSDLNKTVDAYLNYTIAVAEAFGANKDRAVEEMSKALNFHREVANISMVSERTRSRNKMNISQLHDKYPNIPWLEYINSKMPESVAVHEDEIVQVHDELYITELKSLLARTPKRTIANYVMSKIVLWLVPYLNNEVRGHRFVYKNKTPGQSELRERWQECIHRTKELDIALNSLYVREYSDRETIREVRDMARLMKETFFNVLQENVWMDYESKVYALAKLATLSLGVGQQNLRDEQKVNEYYKGLEIIEDSYLDIVLRLEKYNADKSFMIFRTPVTKDPWAFFVGVTRADAYYSLANNQIIIPEGVMQGNFFNKERPKFMNYGAIGYLIGHELSHAFDPGCIDFDKDGNYSVWLSESAEKNYKLITDCVVKQYSNYTLADVDVKVNGSNTVNENVSDIVGVKLAYSAYMQWIKEHGEERKLPKIDRSSKQLFWLSAANTWCSKSRPSTLEERAIYDVHSFSEHRINIPLMDNPEFAKDYKCPLGSKMNPVKKCKIL